MIPGLDELRPWVDIGHPLARLLIIWVLAWLLLFAVRKVLHALRVRIAGRVDQNRDLRRVETLGSVFRYISNVVVIGLGIVLTLSEFGISITPILATAGVAGIAIGFGAQSLVKDFFTGFFLLLENQVSEGDLIEAAGKTGTVERVTLRHIRVRDYDGGVHFIPNSMITMVTNRSRGFAYAVIDLNIPRQADLEQVFAWMRNTAEGMRGDPQFAAVIIDDIEIAGVERLDDAVIGVRCRLKVVPPHQAAARREFLRRMKYALDGLQTES